MLSAKLALARGSDFALDVELACAPGITCIMGPSGSGKSTVLAILAGLQRPDRGRIALGDAVWLDSETKTELPVQQRQVAFVFQSLALFPHMTARDNVLFGMPDKDPAKADVLLAQVGVRHLAARKPRTFSGGEAQRVAIARALARRPKLVLLDEPFSALDKELRTSLGELVRGVVRDLGVPVVHVTHNDDEARALADQVIVMAAGRIVERGKPTDVL